MTDNEKLKGLVIWVPDDLKRKFKAAVVANGTTIKQVLIDFIIEYIKTKNV